MALGKLLIVAFAVVARATRPKTKDFSAVPEHGKVFLDFVDFEKAWEEYVTKMTDMSSPHGLQEACVPKRLQHEGAYQGVVVLFHGFSACPDQYDLLGPMLAERGYHVLLPLMPGHGNALPTSDHVMPGKCSSVAPWPCEYPLDNNTNLPVRSIEYVRFAEEINHIVRLAPRFRYGRIILPFGHEISGLTRISHAVAGVSVGAVLAAYAGQATFGSFGTDKSKPLYQRQLIMSGFFGPHGEPKAALLRGVGGRRGFLGNTWFSWGEKCRARQRSGRGGICSFQVKNLAAASRFGRSTLNALKVVGEPEIAVIISQNDSAVSNELNRRVAHKYSMAGADEHHCANPFDQHSALSPHDFEDANSSMWWVQPVTCQALDFLSRGVAFKVSERRAPHEGGYPVCDLGCNPATCPEFKPGAKEVMCGR